MQRKKQTYKLILKMKNQFYSLLLLAALSVPTYNYALPSNIDITPVATAEKLSIFGTVTDATGAPLPSASVILEGTAKGVLSGADGKFIINGLEKGEYKLVVTFLGYKTYKHIIDISDKSTEVKVIMEENMQELSDIVVYGGLTRGQAKALTRQKNANRIVNIIDYEQSSKFPDRNTAESLQRIPGISIKKDQGEGEYVMIRGLAPQYNSIQLNGQRIPSPDIDDQRGAGMGLLLADMMQTIEINKSSTPDMDGDAIGGSVNFNLKEAPDKTYLGASIQGGYNFQHSYFNDWGNDLEHASIMYGQRFFNNRLGLLVSGSFDNNNIGSMLDQYTYEGDTENVINKRWNDYDVRRTRYGIIVSPDFRFNEKNKIRLLYTYNQFNDDEIRRRSEYDLEDPSDATMQRETRNRIEKINTAMLQLSGEHYINRWKIDYALTNIHSNMDEPDQTKYRFDKNGIDLSSLTNDEKKELNGKSIVLPENETLTLAKVTTAFDEMTDRDNTAQLNITVPFSFLQKESKIKFGGKYLDKKKEYTKYGYTGTIDKSNPAIQLQDGHFGFVDIKTRKGEGIVPVTEYKLNAPIDEASYKANENVISAYIMGELKWLDNFTSVIGVRYEHTANDYLHFASERTGKSSYANFLPSINLIYNVTEKSNIKLAYSEGLSRPGYSSMVPYYNKDEESLTITQGNPNLKAVTAHSFDLLFEHYTNNLGMFTAGIFYKDISGDITTKTEYQTIDEERYEVITPVNMESSKVWGAEIALNHQFKYLNVPFLRNLGVYANYTFTRSLSSFEGRKLAMSNSPEHVANLSFFYENEKTGWSFALTNTYRANLLYSIGKDYINDQYYGEELNMDFTISKRIWKGLSASFQINNITDQPERQYIGDPDKSYSRLQQTEYYGQRIQLGITWKL